MAAILNSGSILNFRKTLKKSPAHLHGGECDSKIRIISDFNFLRPQNFLQLTSGGHFEFW